MTPVINKDMIHLIENQQELLFCLNLEVKMSKKVFLFIIFFSLLTSSLFSQASVDVNDAFYEDAVQWEISGKVQRLPMVRPYPIPLVKDILLKVMKSDDEFSAKRASYYYRQFFGNGIVRFGADSKAVFAVGDYGSDNIELDFNPFLCINTEFLEKCSVSFALSPILTNTECGKEVLPVGFSPRYDYQNDTSNIGPINIFTSSSSMVAYGTSDIYIQAGMSRSSFGDFYNDGILLNSKAHQSGNISFTINKEKLSFSLGMLMLSATDVKGNNHNPQKYLYFHSLRYTPFPSLDLTFYESAMTGPRFDFTYLLPASLYMPIQQLIGFDKENLMMGIQVSYVLRDSLRFIGDICVDDLNFNSLARLNFDTRIKFASQMGIQYAPSGNNMLKMLYLDYTIVAPYMYTHSEYNGNVISYGLNYQNHTTNGEALGSQLLPNSDKIKLGFKLEPFENLKLSMMASIIRHSNINEDLPFDCIKQYLQEDADYVNTSGNIFDYPDAGNDYFDYCLNHFMFLTQPTKYVCMQNSIKAEYTWELGKRHTITAFVEWFYQFEKNAGIDRNIYTGGHTAAQATEELAARQLAEWRNSLTNKISNFFSFGVKYTY